MGKVTKYEVWYPSQVLKETPGTKKSHKSVDKNGFEECIDLIETRHHNL